MKANIGVDVDSGLVHTVTTTPANEADVEQVDALLHAKEEVVHADAGNTGAPAHVRRRKALQGEIAGKRSKIKAMKDGPEKRAIEHNEPRKASIRARVEHPFRVIKRQFGLMKVREITTEWLDRSNPQAFVGDCSVAPPAPVVPVPTLSE